MMDGVCLIVILTCFECYIKLLQTLSLVFSVSISLSSLKERWNESVHGGECHVRKIWWILRNLSGHSSSSRVIAGGPCTLREISSLFTNVEASSSIKTDVPYYFLLSNTKTDSIEVQLGCLYKYPLLGGLYAVTTGYAYRENPGWLRSRWYSARIWSPLWNGHQQSSRGDPRTIWHPVYASNSPPSPRSTLLSPPYLKRNIGKMSSLASSRRNLWLSTLSSPLQCPNLPLQAKCRI